jgi:transmembrane sensor
MTENNRIDAEAALWVVRHRDGVLADAEQHEFDAWVRADPRHRGAFVRLSAVSVDLQRLTALSTGKWPDPDSSFAAYSPPHLSRRWAIAAGVASLVAGSGAWLTWRSQGEKYVSGVGELRQVSLADGSSMTLNTDTEARVRFSNSAREIQLTRGEAHFEVAKDPVRPFVVRSDGLTVTAIGTAFSVRADRGRVDVTVTEGVVELVQADTTSAVVAEPHRRVSANQRAIVTAARPVEVRPIEHEEAERRLAWRAGMVAFNGEPLAEAVAEVNRHNRRRIVIEDPALAGRPVIGMFRANDIETFAHTAAAAMGGRVVEEGDLIRLEAKPAE